MSDATVAEPSVVNRPELKRVIVKEIVTSRYGGRASDKKHHRPTNWDERREGIDVIKGIDGADYRLRSSGQQSPPQPGWEILLTGGDKAIGFDWTLYGFKS